MRPCAGYPATRTVSPPGTTGRAAAPGRENVGKLIWLVRCVWSSIRYRDGDFLTDAFWVVRRGLGGWIRSR